MHDSNSQTKTLCLKVHTVPSFLIFFSPFKILNTKILSESSHSLMFYVIFVFIITVTVFTLSLLFKSRGVSPPEGKEP